MVCLDTGEMFESAFQAGRAFGIAAGGVRTSASTGVERNGLHFYYGDEPKPAPEFFKERHSKIRPIVCLETGETFMGNSGTARPLHVSPAAISQAVRCGSPVNGLHFYHGDEPKPAPEFFKPAKVKGGKSPAAMAAAAKAAAGNGCASVPDGMQRNRHSVYWSQSVRRPRFPRAPSCVYWGAVSICMRRVSLMADGFSGSRETLGGLVD